MRFDNPIYDHGFIFPDIADFPDIINEKKCTAICMIIPFLCALKQFKHSCLVRFKSVFLPSSIGCYCCSWSSWTKITLAPFIKFTGAIDSALGSSIIVCYELTPIDKRLPTMAYLLYSLVSVTSWMRLGCSSYIESYPPLSVIFGWWIYN